MDELIFLSEGVYYLPGFTNIGVLSNGEDVVIVDSGIDKAVAKKIASSVEGLGRRFSIINTHYHADHCGGNPYLIKRLDAKVYAPFLEEAFIRYPYLEPFSMFSGATPLKELMVKFLMAKPSRVDVVVQVGSISIGRMDIDIVKLPGHSPNHIGVLFKGVLFCGDAVFPERVIRKYRIPFVMDVDAQIKTLCTLLELDYKVCLPAHGKPVKDVSKIVRLNRAVIDDVIKTTLSLLSEKMSTELLIKRVCDYYGVNSVGATGYYLMHTTIMSYLSYLYKSGRICVDFSENIPYWSLVK